MRVIVIGNCNAVALSSWLRVLAPSVEIETIQIGVFRLADESDRSAFLAKVSQADVVISQYVAPQWGALSYDIVKSAANKFVLIPSPVFVGFHPDCIYLRFENKLLKSAMDDYHSAIVVASFLEGYSPAQCATLFNKFVFSKLGFYSVFEESVQILLKSGDDLGFDFRPLLSSGVCFMHTVNHPTSTVFDLLARQIYQRLGVVTKTDASTADVLASSSIWPVYPDLDLPISSSGSMNFTRPGNADVSSAARALSLPRFIEDSFARYGTENLQAETEQVARVRRVLKSTVKRSYLAVA